MVKALWLAAVLFVQGTQPAQATVTVSGRVIADQATKSRVIRVAMSSSSGGEALTTVVDSDGTFEFSKVPAGTYTARAFAATSLAPPIAVTVGAADVTDLTIRLPEPKGINGRITVQGSLTSNVPMPRAAFLLAPLAGIPTSSATLPANAQPDGSFRISLPQGERQINLEVAGMHLIGFLIMGAIVGWLAGKIMSGHGYGIIWDVVLGIVGSFLGGFIFSVLFGTQPTGLVISFIGAA